MSETSPKHYKFPGGAEVNDISAHLTSNGGQALQYVARSTRLDPENNKGDSVDDSITDLKKAKVFIDFEIERLRNWKSDNGTRDS